jgi:hypothetical protein
MVVYTVLHAVRCGPPVALIITLPLMQPSMRVLAPLLTSQNQGTDYQLYQQQYSACNFKQS